MDIDRGVDGEVGGWVVGWCEGVVFDYSVMEIVSEMVSFGRMVI